jgi:hypothetical protein
MPMLACAILRERNDKYAAVQPACAGYEESTCNRTWPRLQGSAEIIG